MKPFCLETITFEIFSAIAGNFPIVSASDEFYYFPQVTPLNQDWRIWDQFSPDVIIPFVRQLSTWKNELEAFLSAPDSLDGPAQTEVALLRKMVLTLLEQLEEIRTWETHPTLYLTIGCLGLAEAINSSNPDAARLRAETLPEFLDRSGNNLKNVPKLFQELGLEMAADTRDYFLSLLPRLPELRSCLDALDRFEQTLISLSVRSDCLLPRPSLERIVTTHINCGIDIFSVNEILDLEIEEMTRELTGLAEQMGSDSFQAAYESVPLPQIGEDGIVGAYRSEVIRLGRYCRKKGWVNPNIYQDNPVKVMPVPGFLKAVRAASSYSIPPTHPPSGGTFYIINAHDPEEIYKGFHRDYQILCAHETWPGHHLLDISRWSLKSPVRRAIEQPVFYEGWACFAETMLYQSGYLSGLANRLLIARRRLWRAIRGKVDLGIQAGTMNFKMAEAYLSKTGMTHDQARASVRKYPLNPGYQLCYTIGLRNFMTLFEHYGQKVPAMFLQEVLGQGEIGFDDLKKILIKKTNRNKKGAY